MPSYTVKYSPTTFANVSGKTFDGKVPPGPGSGEYQCDGGVGSSGSGLCLHDDIFTNTNPVRINAIIKKLFFMMSDFNCYSSAKILLIFI